MTTVKTLRRVCYQLAINVNDMRARKSKIKRKKQKKNNTPTNLSICLFQFAHINSSKLTTNGTLNLLSAACWFFFSLKLVLILFIICFFLLLLFLIFFSYQCNVMLFPLTINIETFPWWYQKSHTTTHTAISISLNSRDKKNRKRAGKKLYTIMHWVEMIRRAQQLSHSNLLHCSILPIYLYVTFQFHLHCIR